MKISMVMPIYNKAQILSTSIEGVLSVLDAMRVDFELIAIVDGATDNSESILRRISHPKLRKVFFPENQGKGAVIRYGMRLAEGDYIGFIDCGMDIAPESLVRAVIATENNVHAIAASKAVRGTNYNSSLKRKLLTHGFIWCRNLLFDLPVRDTQVGLKLYRRDAIKFVLPYLEENRWLLDIEVFALMSIAGFRDFLEVPVIINMTHSEDKSESSKFSSLIDIFSNLFSLSIRLGRLSFLNRSIKTEIALLKNSL